MNVQIVEHLWVPLPDGRRLAAKLWRPDTSEDHPAILEYLPYRKRDGTAPRDATTHPVFAAAGYACLRVDISGSGESDGLFDDEYSEQELQDGVDVLAWMSEQIWCNGRIGMIGISWGGFNSLQIAARRPSQLKAIVTVCSTVDRYADDIHYMGGCLLTDNFNWGCQMTAYMTRPPDPDLRDDWKRVWLERLKNLPFSSADWLRQSTRHAFWKHGSVCEDWQAIEAATLAIGGWADAYVNAPLALVKNLHAPCQSLLGPWEHKYPHIARINPADFHGEVLNWFDHYLKGVENGVDKQPAMRAWIPKFNSPTRDYASSSGRWTATDTPGSQRNTQQYHLHKEGLRHAPSSGSVAISTPLSVGSTAAYFCPGMRVGHELSDDQREDDALSVCFDSEPLEETLEVLGRPVLNIAFRVDKPTAQMCVRLCDANAEGVSQRVSYRAMNLCHITGHETPTPLQPGLTYHARIALNNCAHFFDVGQKIRVALSTSYWPVIWPARDTFMVELDLQSCTLELPVLTETEDLSGVTFPQEPRSFPTVDIEVIRDATSRTVHERQQDGALVHETWDDFGEKRYVETNWTEGSQVHQRFAIHPDDPLCASHFAEWQYQFAREDWRVVIDSQSRMTSSDKEFLLERQVSATENGELIFERTWKDTIPRGLC